MLRPSSPRVHVTHDIAKFVQSLHFFHYRIARQNRIITQRPLGRQAPSLQIQAPCPPRAGTAHSHVPTNQASTMDSGVPSSWLISPSRPPTRRVASTLHVSLVPHMCQHARPGDQNASDTNARGPCAPSSVFSSHRVSSPVSFHPLIPRHSTHHQAGAFKLP